MRTCPPQSVGAIIKREFSQGDGEKVTKFLLIDRVNPPYGWAAVAGHIEEHQTPEDALRAEVNEEVGLIVVSFKLVLERMMLNNNCRRSNGEGHHWYVFDEIEVTGTLEVEEEEAKQHGWFTSEEVKGLELEPVWRVWFEELRYI